MLEGLMNIFFGAPAVTTKPKFCIGQAVYILGTQTVSSVKDAWLTERGWVYELNVRADAVYPYKKGYKYIYPEEMLEPYFKIGA